MNIQYAVMIDTRVQELTGVAADFIQSLEVTRLNTAPVFGEFYPYAVGSVPKYDVVFYASESDRRLRSNAKASWTGLNFATAYSTQTFTFADGTSAAFAIKNNVTPAALTDPLYFQIHPTTIPEIGLFDGAFCWVTGKPNFGISGGLPAQAPVLTNSAARYLRAEDRSGISWTSLTVPSGQGPMLDIAFSGKLYVAVGSSGGCMTSPDGVTWTTRNAGVGSTALRGVAWSSGASLFVAVGNLGTIITSPDGINWTPRTSGTSVTLTGVDYAGGYLVASGASNTVLRSLNGVDWAVLTISGTSQTYNSTAWNGSLAVIVGTNGAVQTSPDLTTWSARTSGTGVVLNRVIWSGTQFVVTGVGGVVLTSPDGLTWTSRTTGVSNELRGIAYNGSTYVVTGFGGTILTSPDAVTWTSRTSGTSNDLYTSVWTGRRFITSASNFWQSQGAFRLTAYGSSANRASATSSLGSADLNYSGVVGTVSISGQVSIGLGKVEPKDLPANLDIGEIFRPSKTTCDEASSPVMIDPHARYVSIKKVGSILRIGAYISEIDRAFDQNPIGKVEIASPNSAGTVTVPGALSFTLAALSEGQLPLLFEVPAIPENTFTGEMQRTWKEGVIAKESLGRPGMAVDPSLGGSYSSMSGMDAKIVNMLPGLFNTPIDPTIDPEPMSLGEYLRQKDILLQRCKLRFYQVESKGFQLVNTFLVENVSESDQHISLQCADTWISIHKEMPEQVVDSTTFPDSPEDSWDKVVPLCIGRVPEALMLPLSANVRKTVIASFNGQDSITTRATGWSATNKLRLYTGFKIHGLDDLKDKFLRVTRTGETSPSEVYFNTIIASRPSVNQETIVTLAGPFRKSDGTVIKPNVNTKETQKAWWFQVFDFPDFRAVSDGPIKGFAGKPMGWDGKKFFDVSRKLRAAYPAADSTYAKAAGCLVRPEGEAVPMQPQDLASTSLLDIMAAKPTLTTRYAKTGLISTDFPTVGYSCPRLFDGSLETLYTRQSRYRIKTQWGNLVEESVPVRCVFPQDLALEQDEALYLGIDADFLLSGTRGRNLRAHLTVRLIDVAGNATSRVHEVNDFWTPPMTFAHGVPAEMNIRQIGTFHYNESSSTAGSYTLLPTWISDLIKNKETRSTLAGLEVSVRMSTHVHPYIEGGKAIEAEITATYRLREVALFQKRDDYTGDQYIPVEGVTFGADWPGKPADGLVASIPDAIEYIIRRRDLAGAEVETLSFDFCRDKVFTNGEWDVGRQILEPLKSVEYIEELCRHGFCSIVPGRDGKRRLLPIHGYKKFIDDPHFPMDRNFSGENIVAGSFKDSRILGMDRVFTGLTLKYDFNPATEEYRSLITVRHTDKPRFPAQSEVESTTGAPLWKTYVGGVKDYTIAKQLWGGGNPNEESGFRKAYMISQSHNNLVIECPWFIANQRFGLRNEDSALNLALILSQWFAVPRVDYSFRVPASPYNLDLYLLQRITVRDDIRTNGRDYCAVITGLELDPVSSEIEVTCQRLLTDKPYEIPTYLHEGIEGEPAAAPEVDTNGNPVLLVTDVLFEDTDVDTITETFYP